MFCKNCGNQLEEGSIVCSQCGQPVQSSQDAASGSNAGYSAGAANAYSAGSYDAGTQNSNASYGQQPNMNYNSYGQQPNMNYGAQPTAKPGPGTGAKVGCVFLCIFAVCFFLFAILMFSIQNLLSPSNIKAIVKEAVKSSDFDVEIDMDIDDATDELIDNIKDLLAEQLREESGVYIDPDDLDDIFDRDEIEDITYQMISDVATYYVTGEGEPINTDLIVDYLDEHMDDIEDLTGEEFDDDQLDDFRDSMEDLSDELKDDYENDFESVEGFEILQTFFSVRFVIIPLVLGVLCLAGVFGIFNKFIDKSLVYTGVSSIVCGAITLFNGGIAKLIGMVGGDVDGAVNAIFGILARNIFIIGIIVLVVGIGLVIGGKAIRKSRKEQAMF